MASSRNCRSGRPALYSGFRSCEPAMFALYLIGAGCALLLLGGVI